ncbi:hypothetical protein JFL43_20295 [Viridibacillus sp. YIM B01967]|uniref:Polysaccharide chain length determinant N-terminal domain-containing protein n=1 Tax=Viridibacillus soli TaxID=2798301 RepID=A0ABS1HCZ4_9BACL|nr:Wzz/FepE/Etk N-terminal domain-containing protein [Viridibacillus soli]MBK3497129.1 hypothetical protein [Viridibacillus soli]
MEETIELRQLIETIIKGKWLIASITIAMIILASIVSWFVLPEKYESKATIQIVSDVDMGNNGDGSPEQKYVSVEFTPSIFTQRITSTTLGEKIFEKEKLKDSFIISNISATNQVNTNLIDLTYQAKSPQKAHDQLELLIEGTKVAMGNSVKVSLEELEKTYSSQTKDISESIELLIAQYNRLIINNKLPEILVLQTLIGNQVVVDITDKQIEVLSKVDGKLHNQLMQLQKQIEAKTTEYQNILANYQSVKSSLYSFRIDPYVRVIVEPSFPESPNSPNKILNIAIAAILGLMISIGFIFVREYWRNSSTAE